MLLKGVGEVEAAPDRRAAAEMVLIRLCYVADLPPPGDLVRRLTGRRRRASGRRLPRRRRRAVAAVRARSPTVRRFRRPREAPPRRRRAISATSSRWLPGASRCCIRHLLHSVHLVRFAPPVIELRPQPDAPRDLAARLAALLLEATGTRWTIALSAAPGEPTLAEQGMAADTARRSDAAEHPLVRAILAAFPGARIEAVHDARVDAYGLPAAALRLQACRRNRRSPAKPSPTCPNSRRPTPIRR